MSSASAPAGALEDTLPWDRPLGARLLENGRTEFRVWAPRAQSITLRVAGADHGFADAGYGVGEATVQVGHGQDYWYVVDGQELPDPCARWQPQGLRGP